MTINRTSAKGPVETKVKAASWGSYLGALLVLGVIDIFTNDPSVVAALPNWLATVLLPVIPALITLASGWKAKHTPRPDLRPVPPVDPI